ncbi:colicin-like pore-forming protein [Klebsiella pneumoniae]|uniref:colicin-like pore-forming protein n=1 Tax=Klebsiella pneumoniae TaxID=573 RepID=UPI001304067C|nr:colicin-like pore-forming protein [Klebsiella pneumoniae]
MAQSLDYVVDVPVDTLIVTADPTQPAIWTNTSEIENAVQQSAYVASNAMLNYLQRHAGDIFVSEMNFGFQEDAKRLLAANGKVAQAQSNLNDTKTALDQAQENGTPQQIAQAKLNYLNAQKNLYQARNEMRQASSQMMSQQILYNNGLIGFGIVPDGETPDSLNNTSNNYQSQINQMQQATNQENEFINQVNANINQTTNDLNTINAGGHPDGYKNNRELAIQSSMTLAAQSAEKIAEHAGNKAGEISRNLANTVRGDKVRNYTDAKKTLDKLLKNPKLSLNQSDKNAINQAITADKMASLSREFDALGKTFGLLDKGFTTKDIYEKYKTGYVTGDWEPLMLQLESMVLSGIAAAYTYSFVTGISLGIAAVVGVTLPATAAAITAAIAAAVVASYFDVDFAEKLNNQLIPQLY